MYVCGMPKYTYIHTYIHTYIQVADQMWAVGMAGAAEIPGVIVAMYIIDMEVHICMYTCTHVCIHAFLWHESTYMYVCMHACICHGGIGRRVCIYICR
jgi:hypothetical protein